MRYYLAPYTGTGKPGNPYRPGVDWFGGIDLRGDPTDQAGYSLVRAAERPSGAVTLGDNLDEPLTRSVRRRLEAKLRVSLEDVDRLRAVFVQLLLRDGTGPYDRTRWNRLTADNRNRHRIVIGDEIVYDAPAIMAVTDDFNRGDEALEASANWDATYSSGGFSITSNTLETNTGTGRSVGWWSADTFGPDCYVQADHLSLATQAGGIMICYDGQGPTGDGDFYFGRDIVSSYDIGKVIAGSFTQLATGGTPATGLYYFQASGSTLTLKVDAVQELQTTDTSISIAGFAGFFSSGTSATWDNFEAAVLVSVAAATVTGTAVTGGVTEAEIVNGGETVIVTLTDDTWVATVGADNAITTALIAGITSTGAEGAGWNAEVRDNLTYLDVARTSNTVVTIPLPPSASYQITADETITVTVPATALAAAAEVTATPSFPVTAFTTAGSVWIDTARFLRPHFTKARTDVVTTARTTAAGALNTTTGVYAAPTTSTPLAAVGVTIRYGNQTTYDFGQEATDRDMYTLFLAYDADIQTDDRVTIDTCVLDADLVGDVLIVTAVDQDTLNARKAVVCELAV